ncbi:Hypothetical_protein [Hexamita inflata]|uniref:Hypothetical_protein n=1 Tax=Hexamita inflata TaxID=28002 RepID=A0AA86R9V8_9EUKA|nr:Hypothetical protein HINF_LOCUS56528 [Hexamita inflata]
MYSQIIANVNTWRPQSQQASKGLVQHISKSAQSKRVPAQLNQISADDSKQVLSEFLQSQHQQMQMFSQHLTQSSQRAPKKQIISQLTSLRSTAKPKSASILIEPPKKYQKFDKTNYQESEYDLLMDEVRYGNEMMSIVQQNMNQRVNAENSFSESSTEESTVQILSGPSQTSKISKITSRKGTQELSQLLKSNNNSSVFTENNKKDAKRDIDQILKSSLLQSIKINPITANTMTTSNPEIEKQPKEQSNNLKSVAQLGIMFKQSKQKKNRGPEAITKAFSLIIENGGNIFDRLNIWL